MHSLSTVLFKNHRISLLKDLLYHTNETTFAYVPFQFNPPFMHLTLILLQLLFADCEGKSTFTYIHERAGG